eukprot:412016_1
MAEAEIAAMVKEVLDAYKAKDWDKCLTFYMDDAIVGFGGMPLTKKCDLKKTWTDPAYSDWEAGEQKIVDTVLLATDIAVGRGTFTMKDNKTGKETEYWYLVTMKKCCGKWLIHTDAAAQCCQ